LLQLKAYLRRSGVHWVVFSTAGVAERKQPEAPNCCGWQQEAGHSERVPRWFSSYSGGSVKEVFEELKGQVTPDLIFTHWQGDAHQDHRLLSDLTWNTFRNHLILEYEIPKYDGDLGRPNMFVPLRHRSTSTKLDHLFEAFESQRSKPWFAREMFLGLMRVRGMESNAPADMQKRFTREK